MPRIHWFISHYHIHQCPHRDRVLIKPALDGARLHLLPCFQCFWQDNPLMTKRLYCISNKDQRGYLQTHRSYRATYYSILYMVRFGPQNYTWLGLRKDLRGVIWIVVYSVILLIDYWLMSVVQNDYVFKLFDLNVILLSSYTNVQINICLKAKH